MVMASQINHKHPGKPTMFIYIYIKSQIIFRRNIKCLKEKNNEYEIKKNFLIIFLC